jgi:hypothetical protein
MLDGDTKKMYILPWKYLIIAHAMSRRLVEGGERGLPAKAASLALQWL